MLWYLITKNILFAGHLLNYALAPFVGYTSEAYLAGQACSGISFLGTGGQGFFLPGHMGDGLVLGLTVISVEGYLSNSLRLCAGYAEVGNISRQCIILMYCA